MRGIVTTFKIHILLIGCATVVSNNSSAYFNDYHSLISQRTISSECKTLPKSFASSDEVLGLVKNATFNFTDNVNTSSSSWIRGATFYSCDAIVGFLIIETDTKDYIHQRVPMSTWKDFKKARSFGSFYHKYIKGNYQLNLK
ncbi:MAG: KTSC domain-containing protein [Bacteroidales bacterium]